MFARHPRTMPVMFLLIGFILLAYGLQQKKAIDVWTDEAVTADIRAQQEIDDLVYAQVGQSNSGAENPEIKEERHAAIESSMRQAVAEARKSARNILLGAAFLIAFMSFAIYKLWRSGELTAPAPLPPPR